MIHILSNNDMYLEIQQHILKVTNELQIETSSDINNRNIGSTGPIGFTGPTGSIGLMGSMGHSSENFITNIQNITSNLNFIHINQYPSPVLFYSN